MPAHQRSRPVRALRNTTLRSRSLGVKRNEVEGPAVVFGALNKRGFNRTATLHCFAETGILPPLLESKRVQFTLYYGVLPMTLSAVEVNQLKQAPDRKSTRLNSSHLG